MDRQSLIGFGLIFVIIVTWSYFVSQFYESKQASDVKEKAGQETRVDSRDGKLTRSNGGKNENENGAIQVRSLPSQTHAKPVNFYRMGTEKKLEVETELFRAAVSSKGATLVSFVQKKHLAYDHSFFDLITDKSGSTSLLFKMRNGDVVSTKDVFFQVNVNEGKQLRGDSIFVLKFEALMDSVSETKLKIEYEFKGNSYVVGYRVGIESKGESAIIGNAYQVVWTGGLGFSEKDRKDEISFSHVNVLMGDEIAKLDAEEEKVVYKQELEGNTKWVTVQNKFFMAALIPSSPSSGVYLYGERTGTDANAVETYTVALKESSSEKSDDITNSTHNINKLYLLYIGPMDYEVIKLLKVELERAMDFGWEWLTRPFAEYIIIPLFEMLENFFTSYGIILILFALIIKIVTFPLTISQTRSMRVMTAVQPKLKKLQEQYKNDPMRLRTEMSKLYRESGANPLSGCLPVLLQFPILIALFNVFRSSIQLRQQGLSLYYLTFNILSILQQFVTNKFTPTPIKPIGIETIHIKTKKKKGGDK
ncbi:hypothetical protein CHS0354_000822 [Potamilus streckersoni]|uniref:Membrane protein insertase YidC n=1 Tax=Potamilus streckersoni TaxID=2493646 RepID=A0AAE0T8I2_9BIVA|nr:hypothetical protein CHS0354_000822 [Potamilus streckersoni]